VVARQRLEKELNEVNAMLQRLEKELNEVNERTMITLVSRGSVAAGAWVSRSLTNFTQSALLRHLNFLFCLDCRNGLGIRDFERVWLW
jgi:hypothetical protein